MVMQGTGDANITGVNNGKYTMGICFSFAAAEARFGQAQFHQPMTNIAGMAALYSSPLQIVVRGDSDIRTIEDLRGKKIAPGLKGTSGEALMKSILRIHGLGYMDMARVEHLAYSDAAVKMKNGEIDAFMPFTAVPARVIQDIAQSMEGGVRLLSLNRSRFEELKATNQGLSEFIVQGGLYMGQDTDVRCIGSKNVLICQKNLPEQLVYEMIKTLVENQDKLREVDPALKNWTPEYGALELGVPLHPGALKFYRENGAVK